MTRYTHLPSVRVPSFTTYVLRWDKTAAHKHSKADRYIFHHLAFHPCVCFRFTPGVLRWGETAARKRRNIDFSIPTIDTSLILAVPVPKPVTVAFKDQFWTFLAPFSRDLWLVVLFGILFTAIFLVSSSCQPAVCHTFIRMLCLRGLWFEVLFVGLARTAYTHRI